MMRCILFTHSEEVRTIESELFTIQPKDLQIPMM